MSDMQIEHTEDGECINLHSDKDISIIAYNNEDITIKKNRTIKITEGKLDYDVVAGTAKYHVKGAVTENFDDTQDTYVEKGISITSGTKHIYIHGCTNIQLHVGASQLWMADDGNILLKGKYIKIVGSDKVEIHGGEIVSAAEKTHEISGANVKSEAQSNNVVKGGMVMLNP